MYSNLNPLNFLLKAQIFKAEGGKSANLELFTQQGYLSKTEVLF